MATARARDGATLLEEAEAGAAAPREPWRENIMRFIDNVFDDSRDKMQVICFEINEKDGKRFLMATLPNVWQSRAPYTSAHQRMTRFEGDLPARFWIEREYITRPGIVSHYHNGSPHQDLRVGEDGMLVLDVTTSDEMRREVFKIPYTKTPPSPTQTM